MFFVKRALVLAFCFSAVSACAFTFSYGNLLDVKDVKNEGGTVVLPLSDKKYKNVKILSKDIYDFLVQCKTDCRYKAVESTFRSTDYRKAFTNERMLIADVDLNDEITVTFLVFKNKSGFSVKAPKEIVFKEKQLERRIRQYLTNLAEKTL